MWFCDLFVSELAQRNLYRLKKESFEFYLKEWKLAVVRSTHIVMVFVLVFKTN